MMETRHAKKRQYLHSCILILLLLTGSSALWAQNKAVSGIVTDEADEPVIGASVVVKNTTIGVMTDMDGKYTIEAPNNATLVFSFIGYDPVEEKVNGRTIINASLKSGSNLLDDVVVVGYGVQKKVSLTGAIAGVKGSDMIKTKNENPQNMLTGKIAGVRVWQKSAEPGSFANNFDIRGYDAPLVIIDGIPRDVQDFQRLNASDIEDISVLKDASAAIYGVRSANGVVLVTTKKGSKDGKTSITYNGSYTMQRPSSMPKLANPYETMTLYNERAMNKVDGGNIIYGEDQFEAFRNGSRRTTDWNGLVFAEQAPQTQHDFSVSGGNEKTQYYIGLGYFYQEGFFKSGDLNYEKYNLRSNITTKVAKGLTLDLSISGVLDERNAPYMGTTEIIGTYWAQGVLFPAYADPQNTMLNYEGLGLENNTVAFIDSEVSGYRKTKQKNFQSSLSLNYDLGVVSSALKGLSAKALISYDYRMDNNSSYRKEYYQYAYNTLTESYDSKLYAKSSPSNLLRQFYDKQQVLAQFLLNYNRTFGTHSISGVVGWETQKRQGDNFYAQRNLAFNTPYLFVGDVEAQLGGMSNGNNDLYEEANSALIGRINYDYDNRYLLEAQIRYDGSSKFAKGHQWGFFPSVSAGWRISEEPFFKSLPVLSFVNQLKVRASYGVLGDDLSSNWNYEWAQGYNYPAGSSADPKKGYYNGYAPGFIFGDQFVSASSPKPIPNVGMTWYESKTFDVGVDFQGWNGLFGFSFDYFDRRRSNMFARRTGDLPTVVGAEAPLENVNSDRQFGVDLELSHRNKIQDFTYAVKAIGTITRRKHMVGVEKGPWANSYDRWRNDNLNGRYQGVQFGYESAGRYTSWEDIWTYQTYKERDLLPGDYKYLDWNGDGEINGLDEHPYAFDQTPWLNYSLNFDFAYKNFDLNMLFQGSALGSMQYQEPLYGIWGENGGGALEQFLDRWRPVDPLADPYAPKTQWISGYYGYTGHYPRGNSEFNRVSTAYLRLKSVELGYTLPPTKALANMRLRIFANAYNIFTITKVKFVDPEHPDDDLGRMYPLNKTYTVGLSLSF